MRLLARALFGDTACFGEVDDERFYVLSGDIFGEHRRTGQSLPLKDVVLGPPLANVRFVNVMGGFLEAGTKRPPERQPMWLPKAVNFPSGDGAGIVLPSVLTGPLQVESELAVVVGSPLRKASPDEARRAIFGWSVFNDWTAPEYGALGFWAVGKSIDGFASWGPWIRRDLTEERVMEGLAITATINGRQVQAGNTRNFCFAPSEMLSHISHRISLSPGDVVALGTPPPPAEIAVGGHVACEVEEVGVLRNHVISESPDLLRGVAGQGHDQTLRARRATGGESQERVYPAQAVPQLAPPYAVAWSPGRRKPGTPGMQKVRASTSLRRSPRLASRPGLEVPKTAGTWCLTPPSSRV